MKQLKTLFILLLPLSLFGQTPSLIFRSGFEPNTVIASQSSGGTDIRGADLSVNPPNDWVNDLESHPDIGNFDIQYQGGDDTMRLAHITSDPVNPSNKVLHFWIKHPNVEGKKGRIQANIYGNPSGLSNFYYSVRLFLPEDLKALENYPKLISWFTLMEFWNNAGWMGDLHPFRITVNLNKISSASGPLRFGAHGQVKEIVGDKESWKDVWRTTNTTFDVPIGKWMTIELNFIEGDNSSGRLYMAITPDGGTKTVVFDLNKYTHHPEDPNPDGFTEFNPLKLYTSKELIDYMRNLGKLTHVYWDDFELWKDVTEISGISKQSFDKSVTVYPNPFSSETTIKANTTFTNASFTVFNSFGQTVKKINNLSGQTLVFPRENLPQGLYYWRLFEGNKIVGVNKLVILD